MGVCTRSAASILLLFSLSSLTAISTSSYRETTLKGIDVDNPVVDVSPVSLEEYSSATRRSNDALKCERVLVSGVSRFKLGSYANVFRITLAPSADISERLHSRIVICFHQNASLGLCQCQKDDWKSVQKGIWSSAMSPYRYGFVDVKFVGDVSGSVSVTVDEEAQVWRFLFLALGFFLLLLAPVISSWVPFYYSSSMAVGVLLVIVILLFQGMKLLPTGRKNVFYLTIYGSVLGAGSYLLHYFSMLVNSLLVNFGMSEDMHYPVSALLLVGIIIVGGALGYWLVRKFVISEDGSVHSGIAGFVKWAMRLVAVTFIFQSTLDTPLAIAAVASCLAICLSITSIRNPVGNSWASGGRTTGKSGRTEFLSRSGKKGSQGTLSNGPRPSSALSGSFIKGLASPSTTKGKRNQQDFYSTYHKTPNRKKFSKKEWGDFTEESTRQAVADLASSPEFTDWIIEHADRIQIVPEESSGERSASGSTDENVVESGNELGFFRSLVCPLGSI